MVDIRSQSFDESSQTTPNPGGRDAHVAGDLGRIEAGDEAQCEQLAVVWLQVRERTLEVDEIDRVGGIATSVVVDRVGQIDDRPPPGTAESLAGLVGGDRDQPCAHLSGIAQRVLRRRQAIDQAICTASRVASESPQITNATRAIDGECSATSRVKAASSPSAARRTVPSSAVVSCTTRLVM